MQNPEELGAKLAEFETKHAAVEKQLAESEKHRKESDEKLAASEKTFAEYREEREKADKETAEKFEEYDEALKELKKARTVAETKGSDYRREATEKALVQWNSDRAEAGKEVMTVEQVLKYEDALEIAMHSDEKGARTKLLKGVDSETKDMVSEIVKSLSTAAGEGGAIYVPPAFASRVEKVARDVNPLREYAMTIQTSIGKVQRIAQGKTTAAYFEDGIDPMPQNVENPSAVNVPKSIAQNVLVRNLIATHTLSMAQLEDSGFSVSDMLTEGVGMDFGATEGENFIKGNSGSSDVFGSGRGPDGLISNTTPIGTTERVTIGNATLSTPSNYFGQFWRHTSDTVDNLNTAADADAIVQFAADLETRYHPNARFVMHRTTLAQLRGMRASGSGQDGQFLVQDVLEQNLFMTRVLGYPVVLNDAMPTITQAIADNTLPVIFFGDIRMSYTIAQARGMRMLRDQYSAKPNVEFQFTSRHGGQPFMAEAGSVLLLKAS